MDEKILLVGQESGQIFGEYKRKKNANVKLYVGIYFKYMEEHNITINNTVMFMLAGMDRENIITFQYGEKTKFAKKCKITLEGVRTFILRMIRDNIFLRISNDMLMVNPYFATKTEMFSSFGLRKKWDRLISTRADEKAKEEREKRTELARTKRKEKKMIAESKKRLRIVSCNGLSTDEAV